MKYTFLGDIHANFEALPYILREANTDIVYQVGDYGWGFKNPPANEDLPCKLLAIRGNHDSPFKAKQDPNYLGDYGITPEGLFYVSGAWSIDKFYRTPEVDWWHDEELSIEDLMAAGELFLAEKPEIIMTHDCPAFLARVMVELGIAHRPENESWGRQPETKTSKYLEEMWNRATVKPRVWVFGHWHLHFDRLIRGTRFICVPIDTLQEVEI